jgi:DNA-binding transcriptional LysR family regulator
MWLLKNAQGQTEPHEVPVRHDFFDGDALESACLAGCGLAQLPTWLAGESLRSSALVEVLSELTGGAMPIHVVWQKTWHLQPKVRVTVDELLRVAANAPHIFNAGAAEP